MKEGINNEYKSKYVVLRKNIVYFDCKNSSMSYILYIFFQQCYNFLVHIIGVYKQLQKLMRVIQFQFHSRMDSENTIPKCNTKVY